MVHALELRNTFDFVSAGAPLEQQRLYLCRHWEDLLDVGYEDRSRTTDDVPVCGYPRLWTATSACRNKNDLDLGRRLSLAFAEKDLRDDYEKVVRFFQRRGSVQSLQGPAADATDVG